MIKLSLFSVYDSAAKVWFPPFVAQTVEVALRNFRMTVNSPESNFNRFPEDYALFLVGEFDQETGMIVGTPAPQSLGVAITFLDMVSDNGQKAVASHMHGELLQRPVTTLEKIDNA